MTLYLARELRPRSRVAVAALMLALTDHCRLLHSRDRWLVELLALTGSGAGGEA